MTPRDPWTVYQADLLPERDDPVAGVAILGGAAVWAIILWWLL